MEKINDFLNQKRDIPKKEDLASFFGDDFIPYNPEKKNKKEIKLDDLFENELKPKKEVEVPKAQEIKQEIVIEEKPIEKVVEPAKEVSKEKQQEPVVLEEKEEIAIDDAFSTPTTLDDEVEEEIIDHEKLDVQRDIENKEIKSKLNEILEDNPPFSNEEIGIDDAFSNKEDIDSSLDDDLYSEPIIDKPIKEKKPLFNKEKTPKIKREKVKKEKPIKEKAIPKEKPKKERSNNKNKALIVVGSVIGIALIAVLSFIGLYFARTRNVATTSNLFIELTTEQATVNYSDDLDLLGYIKDCTSGANINYTKLEHKLGYQTITYTVSNEKYATTATLTLNVVDTEEPTFDLTNESITIGEDELKTFDCTKYINFNSFKDNFDSASDLNFKAACPDLTNLSSDKNGALIIYEVSDTSGNIASRTLEVKVER